MNLSEINARLAEIDIEVRESQDAKEIESRTAEMLELREKKAELENLEARKREALDIQSGKVAAVVVEERKDVVKMDFENMTALEVRGSEEYRSAFLKHLQGLPMSDIEKRANEIASTDVAGVIPTLTQEKIFNKLKEYAPLLSEITLLQVAGNVTVAVEGTNNAAAIHAENDLIEPAADTMVKISLAGYEVVKLVRISATVSTMAINAFESWLVDVLSENISAIIGTYIIYGDGDGEPKGIDYSNTWTDGTNAVIPTGATPTAAELVELVGYLKGGYKRRAKFVMNSQTFWGSIVAAQQNDKFKILTDDYSRILGYPVLLDDNVAAGDIFFGDLKKVVGNLSQNIKVDRSTESGFAYNAIDYRGTAIFDCDIAVAEAFVKCAKVLTAGK